MFRDYRYVENYPGYIISNFGEVFSTKRGNVIQLKGTDDGNGYLRVTLKNKNHKIHVLVGELDLPPSLEPGLKTHVNNFHEKNPRK